MRVTREDEARRRTKNAERSAKRVKRRFAFKPDVYGTREVALDISRACSAPELGMVLSQKWRLATLSKIRFPRDNGPLPMAPARHFKTTDFH